MTQRPPSSEDPGRYEIRVRGHLDTRWAAWFDGLTLTHTTDGITVLHGLIVDQAALHGVLHRLADLGLILLSVTPTPAPAQAPTPTDRSEGDRHDH